MVVANMMCMELVLNKDSQTDPLEASRKVCGFMAKKLGVSREDLPSMTKTQLDQLNADTSGGILGFIFSACQFFKEKKNVFH